MSILLIVAIVLFVAWLVGMGTRYTLGGLVHIALGIAVILVIVWLLRAVLRVF
jgi:hypothetical protein